MKAWLMALALGRRRELITKAYTANATVPIPQGVSRLESIIGKGAAGQPGTPGTPGQSGYTVTTNTAYRRRDGKPDDVILGSPSSPIPGPVPADYCETIPEPSSAVYYERFTCYQYDYKFIPGTGTSPTTGASATGFGQTFVGGTGGPATAREVKNIAVTPGGSYQVVVPSGGSIVISYFL